MSLVMNFVYQATAFVALMALDHRRQTADRSVWQTLHHKCGSAILRQAYN